MHCLVCYKNLKYRNKCTARCGHSFCLKCILKYKDTGTIFCPFCCTIIYDIEDQSDEESDDETIKYEPKETPEMIRLREEHNKKKRIEYEEYQKQRIQEFHNEIEQLKTSRDKDFKEYKHKLLNKTEPITYESYRGKNGRELGYNDVEILLTLDEMWNIGYDIEIERGVIQMKRGKDRFISSNTTRGEEYAKELVEQQKKQENTRGHISTSLNYSRF